MGLPFYIVDVFAETKYAGNQLAVILDAAGLSGATMQAIAKEMNYSETTFILSREPDHGGYGVRIFTPAGEVPFAGHPTLGTAYVIQKELIGGPVGEITLNLKVGPIPVTFTKDNNLLWMKQNQPVFGRTMEPKDIAEMLQISVEGIDPRFPIQEVSTGLPFVIVPLKSLAAVKNARVWVDKRRELLRQFDAKAVLVFAPETYQAENHLNVRVFVDEFEVPEDPATGSANGCLAGYLSKYRYFGSDKVDIRVEQGMEIGRPSLLYLKARPEEETIRVDVGGRVFMIAKGELV